MIAAAFLGEGGKLLGWCANSAISPDNLCYIAETCRAILSANRAEQRDAHTGVVAFGNRTLIFQERPEGLLIVYLDSPTNEAVMNWLFNQVNPLLAGAAMSEELETETPPAESGRPVLEPVALEPAETAIQAESEKAES